MVPRLLRRRRALRRAGRVAKERVKPGLVGFELGRGQRVGRIGQILHQAIPEHEGAVGKV